MRNEIKGVEPFTQRNNVFNPSITCGSTSTAIGLHYKGVVDPYEDYQLEDYITKQCIDLPKDISYGIINGNSTWKWYVDNNRGFQVLPILEYVCKKLYDGIHLSWGITFDTIIENIDKNNPVICLGNFSSISYVSGHYNCIVGYDTEKETVITKDPFGNANTNYKDTNGNNMEYDWKIFLQLDNGNKYSYGFIIA